MRGWLGSIQIKIFAVISALTALIVASLTTYFFAWHLNAARRAMETKAEVYGRLLATQVASAIAFDDQETAREVFAATAQDDDVRAMGLYRPSGQALYVLGEFGRSTAPTIGSGRSATIETTSTSIRVVSQVSSKEGPKGVLAIEFSTESLQAERVRVVRMAASVGVAALLVGFVAAWGIGRSLARRLRVISTATRAVAAGDLSERSLYDASPDEVGQLARAFNVMFASIRALIDQVRDKGEKEAQRLDDLVRARTAELGARNQDMRAVLDNVGDGLFTIDDAGIMSVEQSRAVRAWFGTPAPGAPVWEYLARVDSKASTAFRLGWEALREEILPLELYVDQLPKGMSGGGRLYEFGYTPILAGDRLTKMLVVISDITARVASEEADARQREVVRVIEQVTRDRAGFLEFFSEANALVDGLTRSGLDLPEAKRMIHTLKGNAALFGLASVATICHELESAVAEAGALPGAGCASLLARWESVTSQLGALIGDGGTQKLEVDEADYDSVVASLLGGAPHPEIASAMAAWKLEKAERRLRRIGDQARALARRLHKGEILVSVESNRLRLPGGEWGPLWASLGHLIRNAVDHGLETPEERALAGKSASATLSLRTYRIDRSVILEIGDDGRGIQWNGVRTRAESLGLPHATHADLVDALFADGLTTRSTATEYSGRGVGLAAVKCAAATLGATVSVASEQGLGTTFRFTIPWPADSPARPLPRPSRRAADLRRTLASEVGA